MEVTACPIVLLGSFDSKTLTFFQRLEREGCIRILSQHEDENFLQDGSSLEPKCLVIARNSKSREWIQKIRETELVRYILWVKGDFTKEDFQFALQERLYAVFADPATQENEIREHFKKIQLLLAEDRHFEIHLRSLKSTLIQAEGDIAEAVMQELKTVVSKVAAIGVLNEIGVGRRTRTRKAEINLLHHKAEDLSDVLETVASLERTGVLRLRDDVSGQEGSIHFIQGRVIDATCGAVKGVKAIFRMFTWERPGYVFTRRDAQDLISEEKQIKVDLYSILEKAQDYLRRFEALAGEMPPAKVKLVLNPEKVVEELALSHDAFETLASVVEHGSVGTLLDYCELPDVDLYENLILLRKQDLIRVVA